MSAFQPPGGRGRILQIRGIIGIIIRQMLIEALNIRKTYPSPGWLSFFVRAKKETPALAGVSLSLSPGTITGLTGPNGAGKSTLLRILAGRLLPDYGEIRLNGLRTDDTGLRTATALAETGARSFYQRLSARENLDFFGTIYGLSRAEIRERIGSFAQALHLRDEDLSKRFDALSEGAAQKFSLARALLRRPSVLLLDEPARNLDHESADAFRAFIKNLAAGEGVAVVYVSHNPAELAEVCARTLGIKEGRLTAGSTIP
jgi:ABC-type multidrug transport system ATPase subunit